MPPLFLEGLEPVFAGAVNRASGARPREDSGVARLC